MSGWHLSPEARRDPGEIDEYISRDDPVAAVEFLVKLRDTFGRIADYPRMGRERSELAPNLRSHPHGNYVIFYRERDAGVEVTRVISRYRDIDALFEEN